jgi:predicted RNA-binding Zn ribbon-like protein
MAVAKDFIFFGRLSLDFAQTGDMGWGSRFERLTSLSELGRWLALSPLQLTTVRATARDLQRARVLRSAIWRVANALLARSTPHHEDVRLVNRAARETGLVKALDRTATVSRWYRPTVRAALATIARDAVTVFGDAASRRRMRRCAHPRCRCVFLDDSRPGRRRWCAANRCGDRARAQAYRRRQRAASG